MNGRYFLVVSLWLRQDDVAAFEAFERQAAKAMASFDGRIERAIRVANPDDGKEKPFEVHVVSFPDEFAFRRYRDSEESRRLAHMRETVIAKTVIHAGKDIPPYA